MTAPIRMYGVPLLTYAVLSNVSYAADGTGLITDVLETDVKALVDRGCLTEAAWLKLQTAHPIGGPTGATGATGPTGAPGPGSTGASGTVQTSDGAGGFVAEAGFSGSITTASLVGKTITVTAGVITGFA
jgi:hypothetical protein